MMAISSDELKHLKVSSPGESRGFLLFEPVLHRGKMLFTGQQPLSAMMHGDLLHETS
jgi:hypothetical protein